MINEKIIIIIAAIILVMGFLSVKSCVLEERASKILDNCIFHSTLYKTNDIQKKCKEHYDYARDKMGLD